MMGSWFDSLVYHRRNQTPWASVGFLRFVKEMLWNEPLESSIDKGAREIHYESRVVFTATNRPDVASRVWYELEFTAYDGKRKSVSSQDFDLLMWRAAQVEIEARERDERAEKPEKHSLVTRILAIAESGDLEQLKELAADLRGVE